MGSLFYRISIVEVSPHKNRHLRYYYIIFTSIRERLYHRIIIYSPLKLWNQKNSQKNNFPRKKRRAFRPAAFGVMISYRFLPFSYVSSAICQALRPARALRRRAWAVSFLSKCSSAKDRIWQASWTPDLAFAKRTK